MATIALFSFITAHTVINYLLSEAQNAAMIEQSICCHHADYFETFLSIWSIIATECYSSQKVRRFCPEP
jgi:hypothetical protein